MQLEQNCWVSPPASPESRAREAMKFVRVALVDGYLTDMAAPNGDRETVATRAGE